MADHFKATHTYSDPGLDKENIYEYELSIRMHADGLSYCILDTKINKFLHLESFDLSAPGKKYIPGEPESQDTSRLAQLLSDELKWLSRPFSKVRILYESGNSTLIPEALFNEGEKAGIYDFNIAGGPHKADELCHDYLRGANAYCIYHLPAGMSALVKNHFQEAQLYHHSTAFIQSILDKFRNADKEKLLFVNAGAAHLYIIQIRDKKLNYSNSFRYHSSEDFMYYLVFVVEQLKLNPESVEVILMGEIEKHSPLSDLIHKYIRYIRFIERNTDYRYSFVFDQIPGHYFYNLLNASSCE